MIQQLDYRFGKSFFEVENKNPESATLNGKTFTHNWLAYADIMNGGALHLVKGNKPALNRGVLPEELPFSIKTKG